MANLILNRRSAMASMLAISAAGALAACGQGGTEAPTVKPTTDLSFASEGAFFSASEMAFLASLSETIIPETDTAGAISAGVPETLQDMASNYADDLTRLYWRDGIAGLNAQFKKSGGKDFADQLTALQRSALVRYDADVFDGATENQFYRDIKSTIVQAYYMSEPGATEELAYEPVPGEWIGCVPLSEFPKTWAT
jgi:hypothetical protein